MSIWDEIEAEKEAEIAAFHAAEALITPEQKASRLAELEASAEAFHRQGVEAGSWDEDGKEIERPDEDEEDDDETEEA